MASDGPNAAHVLLGGGIGAGKSAIADLFFHAGFLLIGADAVGAEVLQPHTEASHAVAKIWPEVVRRGIVDRESLAAIVFANRRDLRRLEAITHPAIAAEIEKRVAATADDVIVEVPLMHLEFSGDWIKVAVVADEKIRIARTIERGADPADVLRRVSSQVSENEWMEWADFVIDNSHAWSTTEAAVHTMIREVRE
jgi:dephospho-CoA kinase